MAAAGSSRDARVFLKFSTELLEAEVVSPKSGSSSPVHPSLANEFQESFALEVRGSDTWSYSVHLHLALGSDSHDFEVTFLPHATVDEVTSNRLVLRNVLMPAYPIYTDLHSSDPAESYFAIRSLAILFQPCEAADGFTALLRKVCTEVVSLNKLSVIASQVSVGCRRLQFLTVTCAQACVSDVVRYCKDEINADIADAQYCLS